MDGAAVGKVNFVYPLGQDGLDRLDLFDGCVSGNGLAEHDPDGLGGWRVTHVQIVSKVLLWVVVWRCWRDAARLASGRVFWVAKGGVSGSRGLFSHIPKRYLIEKERHCSLLVCKLKGLSPRDSNGHGNIEPRTTTSLEHINLTYR